MHYDQAGIQVRAQRPTRVIHQQMEQLQLLDQPRTGVVREQLRLQGGRTRLSTSVERPADIAAERGQLTTTTYIPGSSMITM